MADSSNVDLSIRHFRRGSRRTVSGSPTRKEKAVRVQGSTYSVMPSKIQRTKQCHSLRIEYAGQGVNSFPIEPSDLFPAWHRDFEISDKTTLEQLSSTILQILAWDRD